MEHLHCVHAMSARSTTLSEEQARRTLNTSTLHSHTHTPLEHKPHSVWVLAAQSEAHSADVQTVHEHGGEAGNERREGGVPTHTFTTGSILSAIVELPLNGLNHLTFRLNFRKQLDLRGFVDLTTTQWVCLAQRK
jgi:hypothetical protein